jgi:DNA-binding transcriptional LysR family regulator
MRLVERASGTPIVRLTDAGRVLLQHVEEILARFETAFADVSSLRSRTAGVVRVAGLELFAPQRVALILSLFRTSHPFARVSLEDPPGGAAGLTMLHEGKLDVLIYESPGAPEPPEHVLLECDDYVLLAPQGSEPASLRYPLQAAHLAALSPIVPSSRAGSEQLVSQLARLGVERQSRVIPESVATAQALVASGLGTAILPSSLINPEDPKTVTIDIAHLVAPRTIALALTPQAASPSPSVAGFIRAIGASGELDSTAEATLDEALA